MNWQLCGHGEPLKKPNFVSLYSNIAGKQAHSYLVSILTLHSLNCQKSGKLNKHKEVSAF